MQTLVVCSGGLDSVALSHKIAVEQTLIHLVSFDYGQRHRKELECARCCATRLGVTHDIIDIAGIGRRLTGSALTDGEEVPDGHYAEDTMRLTVVPNRNAIMLTIAFGIAMARQAEAVAAAMHGGDHFIYPLPAFIRRRLRRHAALRARRVGANCFHDAISALEQGRHRTRGRAARGAVCRDVVLL